MGKNKTIFISAYHGFISRNIFNTDVLKILRKKSNIRVILIVPSDKKEFITKYYGGDNIIIEGIDQDKLIEQNKSWYRLAFLLENTQYVKDQRKERLFKHRNFFGYINYFCINLTAFLLSNLPFVNFIYRFLDYHLSPKTAFKDLFDKYLPSLVFSTDIFGETDNLLNREAKSRKIPIIGMVRSWDNPTTKGIVRLIPDKIVVNSPTVKDELIKFHNCNEKDIFVAGLPQFDSWLSGSTITRNEFFAKIGADPNKKLVLFAPAGYNLSDTDWQLCKILEDALDDKSLPDIQFLVRNHPQHPADLSMFENDKRFIIEIPGSITKDYKGANLSPEENDHLRNSIYYSEIVMYVATSLGLDASIYDKPQILISFDGWESKPYIQSVKRYNREDCLYSLVKCGGTKVPENKEDLVKFINDYLKDPTLDQEGRNKTVERHLYKIDGRAGERIGNFIFDYITKI